MIFGFKHFHPLNGEPTETLYLHGQEIVGRARKIIKGWKIQQIHEALKAINWILSGPVKERQFEKLISAAERLESSARSDQDEEMDHSGWSEVAEMEDARGVFSLVGYQGLPSTSWAPIFAILALAIVAAACEQEKYYQGWAEDPNQPWLHDYRILQHVAPWLIEAMHAVTLAEAIAREEQIHDKAVKQEREKISLQKKKAAISRHNQTVEATLDLYEFYRKGSFKSMREAVLAYCERFPGKVSHLAPTNRQRTLVERLSKYLKQS